MSSNANAARRVAETLKRRKRLHRACLQTAFSEAKVIFKQRRRVIRNAQREAEGKRPSKARCESCLGKPFYRCKQGVRYVYFCDRSCQRRWWNKFRKLKLDYVIVN